MVDRLWLRAFWDRPWGVSTRAFLQRINWRMKMALTVGDLPSRCQKNRGSGKQPAPVCVSIWLSFSLVSVCFHPPLTSKVIFFSLPTWSLDSSSSPRSSHDFPDIPEEIGVVTTLVIWEAFRPQFCIVQSSKQILINPIYNDDELSLSCTHTNAHTLLTVMPWRTLPSAVLNTRLALLPSPRIPTPPKPSLAAGVHCYCAIIQIAKLFFSSIEVCKIVWMSHNPQAWESVTYAQN